ncbi:tubulin beta-4 chain [Acyrthosiphon pisum]|uniref:Tubulin beta chain n=1 Tax=Acyrthosiphon pisum TaxID=7029 RepID=A0A8R2A1N2_ACYPI|nr:tubulin beta-4 chain [Acyrthosiphon pisum]|eukprot:XP_001946976.1 PREDICTED: tubulin beta-4 chain-like [Acyrthosiphon pisum]
MGEILQIQVGRCGNRIGDSFWKTISNEHGLDEQGKFAGYSKDEQLERINVYYDESKDGVYVPRAVLVDSDSTLLNTIGGRQCGGNAYRKENFVGGHGGTGSNWAKGYYGGGEMSRRVADAVRSEAERCDRLQGFQLVHSLGGGTGSGLGGRVLKNVRASYPNRAAHTYSVAPWTAVSDEPAESYNASLSLARLIGCSRATYLADNRALFDACCGGAASAAPAYADLNHLVTQIMSGTTTGLRFSGRLNADMKKCTANLVLYPRQHFFLPGFAPLTFRGQTDACAYTVPELATHLFEAVRLQRRCADAGAVAAVVMAAVMTFRGRSFAIEPRSGHVPLQPCTGRTTAPEHCWLPDNLKTAIYGVPSHGLKSSGTVVANTTAVRDVFERYFRRSASMLAKRELLHLYMEEGMDSDEFRVAHEQIESLMAEYLSIEQINCTGDGDDVDGDHEDDCGQSSTIMGLQATTSTVDGLDPPML